MKSHREGWRNAKHGAQWEATLNTYANRVFGSLQIQANDVFYLLYRGCGGSPPLAVLKLPVVLLESALTPLAVFWLPVVLLKSALSPLAVLLLPVVLLKSA